VAAIAEAESVAKVQTTNTQLDLYRNAFEKVFVVNDASNTYGVRFIRPNGEAFWVTVDKSLVVASAGAAPSYAKLSAAGEIWVPLIEKAYAQANELGYFGRTKSDNSMLAVEGGLAEPMAFLLGGSVVYFANGNEVATPNFYGVARASANPTPAATFSQEVNQGESLFVGSWKETRVQANKYEWVSGHAFMAYDSDRVASANDTTLVFNPWGKDSAESNHVSPFSATISGMLADPNLMLVYHSTQPAPAWVSNYFAQNATAAKSLSPGVITSEGLLAQTTLSDSIKNKSFLTVPIGVSAAVSTNDTSTPADDRSGLYKILGSELNVGANDLKVFLNPKPSAALSNGSTLLASITGATDAGAFLSAVQTASATADVRFGLVLGSDTDIAGTDALEKGVVVWLAPSTTSTGSTVTFGTAKGVGEVAQAKAASSMSAMVRNTVLSPEESVISVDADTDTVLLVDGREGFWRVGKEGTAQSGFINLTYDKKESDGTITSVAINNDTLEVTALHARAIGTWSSTVTGFEVTGRANDFEDEYFTLSFDSNGKLVNSEELTDSELTAYESEADVDINDNGGIGESNILLVEGSAGAPDIYVNGANDLVLVSGTNSHIPVTLAGGAVSYNDISDRGEILAITPKTGVANGFTMYLQTPDGSVVSIEIISGAIQVNSGNPVISVLSDTDVERLSSELGINLTGDGDLASVSKTSYGTAGGYLLAGGEGDGFLQGESGPDLLIGGPGADYHQGGAGADKFLFNQGDSPTASALTSPTIGLANGFDWVKDFALGDSILLPGLSRQEPVANTPLQLGDQKYAFLLGEVSGVGAAMVFEPGMTESGSKGLVLYDANPATGSVTPSVILVDPAAGYTFNFNFQQSGVILGG